MLQERLKHGAGIDGQLAQASLHKISSHDMHRLTQSFKTLVEKYFYYILPLAGPCTAVPASVRSPHSLIDTLYTTKAVRIGDHIEARNSLVARLGEALLSFVVDLWLKTQLPMADDASSKMQHCSPCAYTLDLVLMTIQHVAVFGLFDEVSPPAKRNMFFASFQPRLYQLVRRPLYGLLDNYLLHLSYLLDSPLFSRVRHFY